MQDFVHQPYGMELLNSGVLGDSMDLANLLEPKTRMQGTYEALKKPCVLSRMHPRLRTKKFGTLLTMLVLYKVKVMQPWHKSSTLFNLYSNQALLNQDSPPASADDDGSRRDLVRGPNIL